MVAYKCKVVVWFLDCNTGAMLGRGSEYSTASFVLAMGADPSEHEQQIGFALEDGELNIPVSPVGPWGTRPIAQLLITSKTDPSKYWFLGNCKIDSYGPTALQGIAESTYEDFIRICKLDDL